MLTALVVALLGSAYSYDLDKETKLLVTNSDKCTTIIGGAKAGTEGPIVSHTSDCYDCDFRLNKVPAQDWPKGTQRPLYVYRENYPNTVSTKRGATWQPSNLQGSPEQIAAWLAGNATTAFIPEVEHTYAIFEGLYGMLNEHQVAIGESTCAARFTSNPTIAGGKARIELREMTKIALERTTTAVDCIKLMGKLAMEYGFYGADWSGGDGSKGEGGETLTVIDKTEAWVFHITADDTGTSAVWVAQRVPDDHVAVVANQFVIRGIDPNSAMFMYSDNLWEVAERNNLWKKGDAHLDWFKTYGMPRAHPYYAIHRMWRVFNLVAPSIKIDPFPDMWQDGYPFSVKVDKKVSPQDIMTIFRDHYEGTQFDMTQGLASGPYGDPARFDATPVDNLTAYDMIQGGYERAISMYRTSYSWVASSRASKPDSLSMVWYGQYAPHATSYTPFYLATDSLPKGYTTGSLYQYDSDIAYWNFCAAGNYASRFYRYAIEDVKALQVQLMTAAMTAVETLESYVVNHQPESKVLIEMVTKLTNDQGNAVVTAWKNLLPQLITKYHDGYMALDLDQPNIYMKSFFYPKYWLDATGYWLNKPNLGPGVILFDANPTVVNSNATMYSTILLTAIISSVVTFLAGAYWVRRNQQQMKRFQNNDYITINL